MLAQRADRWLERLVLRDAGCIDRDSQSVPFRDRGLFNFFQLRQPLNRIGPTQLGSNLLLVEYQPGNSRHFTSLVSAKVLPMSTAVV
jgi:hypothetical protein